VEDGEEIQLEVMSYGGEVFSGLAIAQLITEARKRAIHSTAIVYGIAASAAAILALATDHVIMTELGSLMLHGVWCEGVDGEDEGIRRANEACLAIIQRRCPSYDMQTLTECDHWYSAEEAKALGLIDEIRPLDSFGNDGTLTDMVRSVLLAYAKFGGSKMNEKRNDLDVKDIETQVEEEKKDDETENKELSAEGEDVDLKTLIVDGFSAVLDKLASIEARLAEPAPELEADEDEKKKDDDIMSAKIRAMYDRIGKVCQPCTRAPRDEAKTEAQIMNEERAKNEAFKKLYPNLCGKVSREK
ncbi:MAG: ATP-dependent Clp protease proteolytic subunit, partial [Kiritimatiellae bacterium]|nr:ATP-dependent Clp protease proteolytic subunit [Kiritimatiellia bacterium]